MGYRTWATTSLLTFSLTTGVVVQSLSTPDKEVLAAMQRLLEAQARCDAAEQTRLRVSDHTVIAPSGVMMRGDQLSTMDKNCQPRKVTTNEDLQVRVYNGDTAIITGLQVMYGAGDKPLPKRRFTSVWVKVDGGWRHASYQASTVTEAAAR